MAEKEPAGFYEDPLGVVHLKGYAGGGSVGAAFMLPAGYHPNLLRYFVTIVGATTNVERISATLTGGVVIVASGGPAKTYLEGVSFRP